MLAKQYVCKDCGKTFSISIKLDSEKKEKRYLDAYLSILKCFYCESKNVEEVNRGSENLSS
jgi:DNA-directed RNA polymerase subunit RPC12/RpoP